MKHLYFIALTLFIIPITASAQSNYKPGFIITSTGQTQNGLINYKEWYSNPRSVSFKPSPDVKSIILTPLNTSYFEISGFEAYQGAIVGVSNNVIDIQSLTDEPDTTSTIDTVFLKVVQKGVNVTLLSYGDAKKIRYYIRDNKIQDPIQELKYQPYMDQTIIGTTRRLVTIVKKRNIYYAQLIDLANKYRPNEQNVIDKIVVLSYKEKELMKVTKLLNEGAGK